MYTVIDGWHFMKCIQTVNVGCLLLQLAGENRTGEQVYQPPVSSEDTTPPSKRSKFINTIV